MATVFARLYGVAVLATMGCGSEQPSFQESRSEKIVQRDAQKVQSADAEAEDVNASAGGTGSDDTMADSAAGGETVAVTGSGAGQGNGDANAAGSGTGNANGTSGGNTSTNTAATPTNNAGNSTSTTASVKPGQENLDLILVEDGGNLDLPGDKAARVGINFEDMPGGDFDYNDAVLCFTGAFKVENTNVVSYKKQTITATTFSASACTHRVDVKIINPDGTIKSFSYSSREQKPITMQFDVLSRLEVTMTPATNCPPVTRTMHDGDFALVRINQCNLSGI